MEAEGLGSVDGFPCQATDLDSIQTRFKRGHIPLVLVMNEFGRGDGESADPIVIMADPEVQRVS